MDYLTPGHLIWGKGNKHPQSTARQEPCQPNPAAAGDNMKQGDLIYLHQSHMVQSDFPVALQSIVSFYFPRLCTNTAGQMLGHKREQTLGATVLLPPHTL